MAIKDQCIQCRHYDVNNEICGRLAMRPIYNGSSCEMYLRQGINLTKDNNTSATPTTSLPVETTPGNNTTNTQTAQKKGMFKHPFMFKGRIRRLEFGLSYLIYNVYSMSISLMPEGDISEGFAIIWLMLLIPFYWFFLAQGTKRCHDLGHSGFWLLIPFYLLWMLFQDGEAGSNEYGDNPKE